MSLINQKGIQTLIGLDMVKIITGYWLALLNENLGFPNDAQVHYKYQYLRSVLNILLYW